MIPIPPMTRSALVAVIIAVLAITAPTRLRADGVPSASGTSEDQDDAALLRRAVIEKQAEELGLRERLYALGGGEPEARELGAGVAAAARARLEAEREFREARRRALDAERRRLASADPYALSPANKGPWFIAAGSVLAIALVALRFRRSGTSAIRRRFHVGDAIEVAGRRGSVEAIVPDGIRLRGATGALRTLRFDEVENARMLGAAAERVAAIVRVAYSADIDAAIELFGRVAGEVATETELARYVHGAGEIAAERFAPDGVRLRISLDVAPVAALEIARELAARIEAQIARAGLDAELSGAR